MTSRLGNRDPNRRPLIRLAVLFFLSGVTDQGDIMATKLERLAKRLEAEALSLESALERSDRKNHPKRCYRSAVAAGELIVEAINCGGFDGDAKSLLGKINHAYGDASPESRYNVVFLQLCQNWLTPPMAHVDTHGGPYGYPDAMRRLAAELVKPQRKRRWTPNDAEPFVRAWLIRMDRDGRDASLRKAEADLSIPKTTVGRTTAWTELGPDKRRHVAVHTDLAADNATASDGPDPLGTA